MAKRKSTILTELSTADLKRLLAARERIDILEKEKARLAKELDGVEKELAKLVGGALPRGRKKKVRKKKAAKKKVTKKKISKKKVARKKTPKKKVTRKKTSSRKASTGRVKLEDVIVQVLKKVKGPMAFKDLKATIVGGKLFKTKSANFDNVLRRTLSTSKAVKRVGRGIYDVA